MKKKSPGTCLRHPTRRSRPTTRRRKLSAAVTRGLRPTLYGVFILAGGCAWPSPERQLLLDFFHACRLYDLTVLERLSTVPCNPKLDGVVQGFEIGEVERPSATSRKVSIQAAVRTFDGASFDRVMTITLAEQDGRWMVTGITPPPASQTSPAASSAPPN
jgi:hypothetical protein